MFVSPTRWERTVVVEEVLYTFWVVVLLSVSHGPKVPRRFGGFAQVLQTVQVAVLGRFTSRRASGCRASDIMIILTLNKIFEYVEVTILSRPCGSTQIPRRFDFFA